MNWRDVISFSKHIFRPWAKQIGRCLNRVIRELCEGQYGLGFPDLLGVRDQVRTMARLKSQMRGGGPGEQEGPIKDHLKEMDMEGMFWEIPTEEFFLALQWVLETASKRRRALWFSIAKGGFSQRDRVGRASSLDYIVISCDQVLRYVEFDARFCNLFALGPLVFRQGSKGVLIGGYPSAQLAELWAIWREATFLLVPERQATERAVNDSISKVWRPCTTRGTPPTPSEITLTGENTDFTSSPTEAQRMKFHDEDGHDEEPGDCPGNP